MSDLELAIRRSKRLEHRLRDAHGGTGRGLHELVSSIEAQLPRELVKRLRFVATMRNKLVHDLDVRRLDDRSGFVTACDQCEKELDGLAGPAARETLRQTFWVVAMVAVLLVVGLGIAVFMIHRSGQGLEFRLSGY